MPYYLKLYSYCLNHFQTEEQKEKLRSLLNFLKLAADIKCLENKDSLEDNANKNVSIEIKHEENASSPNKDVNSTRKANNKGNVIDMIDSLNVAVKELSDRLTVMNKDLNNKCIEITEQKKMLEDAKTAIEKNCLERIENENRLIEVSEKYREKSMEIELLNKTLNQFIEQVKEEHKSKELVVEKQQQYERELKDLMEKMSELEAAKRKAQSSFGLMENKLTLVTADLAEKCEEMDHLKMLHESIIGEMIAEKLSMENKLSVEKKRAEGLVESLQLQLEYTNNETIRLQTILRESENSRCLLEMQLSDKDGLNNRLQEKIQEQNRQIDGLLLSLEEVMQETKLAEDGKKLLNCQVAELEEVVNKLQFRLDENEHLRLRMEQNLCELRGEKVAIEDILSELEKEVTSLASDLSEKKLEVTRLAAELNETREIKFVLEEQLDKLEGTVGRMKLTEEVLSSDLASKVDDLERLQLQAEALEDELNRQKDLMSLVTNNLHDKQIELEQAMEMKVAEEKKVEELTVNIVKLDERLSAERNTVVQLEQLINALQRDICHGVEELHREKSALKVCLENERIKCEQLVKQKDSEISLIKKQLTEESATVDELSAMLKLARTQLQEDNEESDRLNALIVSQRNELVDKVSEIQSLQSTISSLELINVATIEQLKENNKRHVLQIEAEKQEIIQHEEECLKELTEEINILKGKLTTIEVQAKESEERKIQFEEQLAGAERNLESIADLLLNCTAALQPAGSGSDDNVQGGNESIDLINELKLKFDLLIRLNNEIIQCRRLCVEAQSNSNKIELQLAEKCSTLEHIENYLCQLKSEKQVLEEKLQFREAEMKKLRYDCTERLSIMEQMKSDVEKESLNANLELLEKNKELKKLTLEIEKIRNETSSQLNELQVKYQKQLQELNDSTSAKIQTFKVDYQHQIKSAFEEKMASREHEFQQALEKLKQLVTDKDRYMFSC